MNTMKITEATTLAELQQHLKVCDATGSFVTFYADDAADAPRRLWRAQLHIRGLYWQGVGSTIAEALESAFITFRRATLPEALKQYASPGGTVGVNEHTHHGITDPNGTFGSPGNTVHRSQRAPASCPKCGREEGRSCSVCFRCFCECDKDTLTKLQLENAELRERVRIAEAIRDDARIARRYL